MSTTNRGAQKFDAYCRRQDGTHRFCLRVAEACDVTIGTVYRWRSGEHRPSLPCAATVERLTNGEVRATDWAETERRGAAA